MTEWVTAPEPPTEKKVEDRNREREEEEEEKARRKGGKAKTETRRRKLVGNLKSKDLIFLLSTHTSWSMKKLWRRSSVT